MAFQQIIIQKETPKRIFFLQNVNEQLYIPLVFTPHPTPGVKV